jgi:hypothetical protein
VRESAPVRLANGIHKILYIIVCLLIASLTVSLVFALIGDAREERLNLTYRVKLGDCELLHYEHTEILHMVQEDVVVHYREDELILISCLLILQYPLQGPDYDLFWDLLFLFELFLLSGA